MTCATIAHDAAAKWRSFAPPENMQDVQLSVFIVMTEEGFEEDFARAIQPFDANPTNAIKVVSRKGMPEMRGKVWRNATIRRDGGWFGGAAEAPDLPLDAIVLSEADLSVYAAALTRNGFFGPGS